MYQVRVVLAGLVLASAVPTLAMQQRSAPSEPAADSSQPEGQPKERLVCRRIVETGSLVRGTRVCRTRAWWDRTAEQQRANSPGMNSGGGGEPSN